MRSPANIRLDKTGDCSTEAITNEHHKKIYWCQEANEKKKFQM